MGQKRMPALPGTGRRYVEGTRRARLASAGIEKYQRRRGSGRAVAAAVIAVVSLVAAMVWLSRP
jgi:hypothetical protein